MKRKDGRPTRHVGVDGPQDARCPGTARRLMESGRIEQIRGDLLAVNQGTVYPVLLKLEHEGVIASEWGASENNPGSVSID